MPPVKWGGIHPRSVEIVEHQEGIKSAEVRPGILEIDVPEIDVETQLLGGGPSPGQLVRVTVDGDDLSTGAGCRETVSPVTACNVEHAHARIEQIVVPREPRAGPSDSRKRWNGH